MRISAVVLAGGRSSRFGRDKLAASLDGSPVLWRTIEAIRAVADDIVVVVGPDDGPSLPAGVRLAHDPEAFGGPLLGLLAGLAAVRHDHVLVVGGDMPWVRFDVLRLLAARSRSTASVATLEHEGRRQQLPIALGVTATLTVGRSLVEAGERRLGALLEAMPTVVIAGRDWRPLDPDAETLRDIDTPDDLPPG